jgi:hypothetical protein
VVDTLAIAMLGALTAAGTVTLSCAVTVFLLGSLPVAVAVLS